MSNPAEYSDKLVIPAKSKALIEKVSNKRARFVLDSIVRNGIVSTEEISKAGYDHPPRAAQDVRDLGFPLKTLMVRHSNGRRIAAYTLDLEKMQNPDMEAGEHSRRDNDKKLSRARAASARSARQM